MPVFAKAIAIPPPIVPAPSTATLRTGSVEVSAGTSGIFAAVRSAKNTWRSACRLSRLHGLSEELALALQAFLERKLDARPDCVDAAHGRLAPAGSRCRVLPRLLEDRRIGLGLARRWP